MNNLIGPDGKHPGREYYYVLCDQCGGKFRAKDCYNRWDGLLVCKEDWELRNPQETLHPARSEPRINPKRIRSEPADQFRTELVNPAESLESGCLWTRKSLYPCFYTTVRLF